MTDKQKLIEENMNLVYFTISQYFPKYRKDDDMIQCGMVGLCEAADTWEESKSQFSTYAVSCIRSDILLELRRRKRHHLPTLSLDYEYSTSDGDVPMREFLQGDEDVQFVDVAGVIEKLSPTERKVFDLLCEGLSQIEIAEICGLTRQRINQIARKIKSIWRDIHGN
jgi:RNA polymerase sigma factor (sigma-70 family)